MCDRSVCPLLVMHMVCVCVCVECFRGDHCALLLWSDVCCLPDPCVTCVYSLCYPCDPSVLCVVSLCVCDLCECVCWVLLLV